MAQALKLDLTHPNPLRYWLRDEQYGDDDYEVPKFSSYWECGGPIIFQKKIDLYHNRGMVSAAIWKDLDGGGQCLAKTADCPDELVAAMRCFVLSELGEEVDMPDELFNVA